MIIKTAFQSLYLQLIDNLEDVTPAENRRRAMRLRRLRKLGSEGWYDVIFSCGYDKLYSLSDDDFNQMLEDYSNKHLL